VFIDRDGVINLLVLNPRTGRHESPYRPKDVALVPGAVEALRLLRTLGVPLVLVSNQPSAAKGTSDLATLAAVHDAVAALLAEAGVGVDDARYCFHHPLGTAPVLGRTCECRKPSPGLILQAARALGLDERGLERSWMIGDSDVDVEAGRAAGLRTVLVKEPRSAHRRAGAAADACAPDVLEAARIVVAAVSAPSPRQEAR
jgi:D-glycero-D-manno-heptose 1,7-bisphosphate phosphatase